MMVARGDLGVEIAVERKVPAVPETSRHCLARGPGSPVITATQMLSRMDHSRPSHPGRGHDVFNAILDGTDAVMLSGETAIGDHPIEAVATLARIAAATEPHRSRFDFWDRLRSLSPDANLDVPDLLSLGIEAVMEASRAAAVVVPTRTGTTARRIAPASACRSRSPPPVPISRSAGGSSFPMGLSRSTSQTARPIGAPLLGTG